MRVSVVLGIILALTSVAALAQKPQTYRPKRSTGAEDRKPAKVTPMPKTHTSDASKELRRLEQQSTKSAAVKPTGAKTGGGSAGAFKPEKTKPTPPITTSVPGGMGTNTKGMGTTNQGKNPYKGRLRQKGSHQ